MYPLVIQFIWLAKVYKSQLQSHSNILVLELISLQQDQLLVEYLSKKMKLLRKMVERLHILAQIRQVTSELVMALLLTKQVEPFLVEHI